MADTEKPFVCSSTGCNMSFSNEDQLTVHKKKHDMMLNLGNSSKNGGFIADQTPTPTRFIRNCEEVGLFQDLQNVNPFEETFRRAVESGNTGTLAVPEAGITDDTLHTPHIFPHIADVLSVNGQILTETGVSECTAAISIADKNSVERTAIDAVVCSVKLAAGDEQNLIKDAKLASKSETLAESIIGTTSPKILPEQTSPQLSINGEEVQLLLKTADGKLMQLSAMPICESVDDVSVHRLKQQTVVIKTDPPLRCAAKLEPKKLPVSALSLAKMKLKQVLTKSTDSQNHRQSDRSTRDESTLSRKENRANTVDQSRKRDILERNRASSMRARAKRKAWIQQLERTVANVNETNVALQMEIKVLRNEVAKLKTILLAHKDCPVTRAMQKGNGIALGPKIISLNPELLTTPAPLSATAKRSGTFSAAEVPIVPKKKISMQSTRNPIIFPKVDCGGNATFVKTVPTLKIVGVNQFLAEKEETKQILIVQNSPRKLGENPQRQIIRINPNYEMENAASKSTGT